MLLGHARPIRKIKIWRKRRKKERRKIHTKTYIAVVSMKLSIGYSGIRERSHLGCPFGTFDLCAKRKLSSTHLTELKFFHRFCTTTIFPNFIPDPIYEEKFIETTKAQSIHTEKFFYSCQLQSLKPWLTSSTIENKLWSRETSCALLSIELGHHLRSYYF